MKHVFIRIKLNMHLSPLQIFFFKRNIVYMVKKKKKRRKGLVSKPKNLAVYTIIKEIYVRCLWIFGFHALFGKV